MLQSIHDSSKGWLTWVVVIIVSLAFILFGTHDYFMARGASDSVATVNGVDITQTQLTQAYERVRKQEPLSAADQTAEIQKRAILQALISNHLLVQAAIDAGLRFTFGQSVELVHAMPMFQVNQQFSLLRFQEILRSRSFTENAFMEDVQSSMLINQMRMGIINSAFVLPNEVNRDLQLTTQKRNIDYLRIPALHFLNKASISERAITDYYQQHRDAFKLPEKISIAYLELSLLENESSPQAEKKFFDLSDQLSNLSYTHANSLDFAAKTLNLPIQTTGLFDKKGLPHGIAANPKVLGAAFASDVLKQGNNSALIELEPHHVIVLRVNQHEPEHLRPLSEVRDSIRDVLIQKAARAQAMKTGVELLDQLHENKAMAIAPFVWKTVSSLTRTDTRLDPDVVHQAFNMPRPAPPHNFSMQGLMLPNGDYVIVRVTAVQTGDDEVNTKIRRLYRQEAAQNNGQLDYNRYVAELLQHAKIVTNRG